MNAEQQAAARQQQRRQTKQKKQEKQWMRVSTSWSVMMVMIAALLVSLSLTTSAQQAPPPSLLTVTVSSQGITPGTATVNAGVLRLTIENQRALERMTLRISDQSGQLIREISLPDKTSEWKTEMNLAVGQYVITDVSNSSASCRITVQTPPQG